MFRLTQKLNSSKSSWHSKLLAKIKIGIYSLFHELLQCQFNSVYLFNCLLLVEAGQFLWFAIHPQLSFLWQTTLSQYPRDILKYLQADYLLRTSGKSFFIAGLYIAFALQVVILLGTILVLVKLEQSKKKSSTIIYYTLRILSLYAFLLITIGPIPLYNLFFEAIICRSDDILRNGEDCYSGINLINLIVGVLGIILLALFTFLTQMFYMDFNPNSEIPFAAPQAHISIYKLALKISLTLYITIDSDFSVGRAFTIFYSLLWLLTLILRYQSLGYYNNLVTIFVVILESAVFWFALVALIQAYIDTDEVDNVGLYYLLILSPFVAYTFFIIFSYHKWLILKGNPRKFLKASQYEKYIYVASLLVENREDPEDRVQLEGVLRSHVAKCRKASGECLCQELSLAIARLDSTEDETKLWYQFLESILKDGLTAFPKSSRLHLQYAYLQHERLQNKYKALFELMVAEENLPSFQEQFAMYRYRNIIEKEMKEFDIRNTDSRAIDVNDIVHFQEKFVILQAEIGRAVNLQLDYWRELEETTPNVQKLLYLGSKITVQADNVRYSYATVTNINSNNIRMLKMYGNFLKDIMNDNFEAQRILEKAEYAERAVSLDKNFFDNDRSKFSENSKACIITLSGNINTMGKVLNANPETQNVLEMSHTDLIGFNISHIMPEVIGNAHDDLMKRYFETSEAHVMGRERGIYPITKSGYMIPCALMIKVYPNLDEGIRVVGFLRKVEGTFLSFPHVGQPPVQLSKKAHYILYGGENDTIYGISEGCYTNFGIPSSLVTQGLSEFTIDTIFPDLALQNAEELHSQQGVVITIDTTHLTQNFLFEREDSDSDDGTEDKRYKKTQVRASLVEDSVFLGKLSLKVLKFIEVSEENKAAKMEIGEIESTLQKKSEAGNGAGSQEGTDVDASRSEASNISVGSSIGDDIRQLKDMKAKIAEKNIPSSIASLRLVSLALAAVLIIIASVQLNRKDSRGSELQRGLNECRNSSHRHSVMADISSNTRILELLSDGTLTAPTATYEDEVRTAFKANIADVLVSHYDVIQSRIYMNTTDKKTQLEPSLIYNLLNNMEVFTNEMPVGSGAYWKYAEVAERLSEIPLSDFGDGTIWTPAQEYIYYIQRNGLNGLRNRSERVAQSAIEFFDSRVDDLGVFLLVTMIVAIVFIAVAQVFFVPRIFSVNKTNMKVLSLFGYIPPEEVEELANRCEDYMLSYLDELTAAKRELSYLESHEDEMQELTQQEHQLETSGLKEMKRRLSSIVESHEDSANINFTMQMKEFPDEKEASHLRIKPKSQLSVDGEVTMNQTKKEDTPMIKDKKLEGDEKDKDKNKKEDAKEDDEEYQEFLHGRSQKLRNSRVHNQKGVVFRILCFMMIFVAYFIGDYIHEKSFIQSYKNGLDHLILIAQRISNLKYVTVYTVEEIAEDDLTIVYPDLSTSDQSSNNTRMLFEADIFTTQSSIRNSYEISFPASFDNYFTLLLTYSNEDLCQNFYNQNSTIQDTCNNAINGRLSRGLVQVEGSLIQSADGLLTEFYANPRTPLIISNYLNGDTIEGMRTLTSMTTPVLESLVDQFLLAFDDYFDQISLIRKIKFASFFAALFLLGLVVWVPYLKRLTGRIFRTKGLLNMIPMSMLKKNKILKDAFISNEVLQALK